MEGNQSFSPEEIDEFRNRSKDNFYMSDKEVIRALVKERDGYKEFPSESEETQNLRKDFTNVTKGLDVGFQLISEKAQATPRLTIFMALVKTFIYLNVKRAAASDDSQMIEKLDKEIVAISQSLDGVMKNIAYGENQDGSLINETAVIAKRVSDRCAFSEFPKKK